MRNIFIFLLLLTVSGCAIKAERIVQTSSELEVDLNNESTKNFKIVDRSNNVISETTATKDKLLFDLPNYTSPIECYRVLSSDGSSLLDDKVGIKITTVSQYRQKTAQQEQLKQRKLRNERDVLTNKRQWERAQKIMQKHNLFTGTTCKLPQHRKLPPFPKTLCRSQGQCENLASDVCIKNLVDAEKCSIALSKTKVHSSITSVSCGALIASLDGGDYGLDSGVADALTGYLDEHTKEMIDSGQYGDAIGTVAIRLAFTYFRTQSCKTSFAEAAYAPIRSWYYEKDRIEKEPYVARDACYRLIGRHNQTFETYQKNYKDLQDTESEKVKLADEISKLKLLRSEVQQCSL